jgi:hypothetical protein
LMKVHGWTPLYVFNRILNKFYIIFRNEGSGCMLPTF